MQVTIHEAKTHLSQLLQKVEEGEEIIIARGKIPIAVLNKLPKKGSRIPNLNKGEIWVSEDFDDPVEDMKEDQ